MQSFVEESVQEYDFVLLDSPPLLRVADSRVLAALSDSMILVVKGGVTPRESVQQARDYAQQVGAHIIGVILNNMDVRSAEGYGYEYNMYSPES